MEPSIHSPDTRNLVITSLMFILYYIGGGNFDDSITLQVINLKFENHIALAVFAWGLLIWFKLKFEQTGRPTITGLIGSKQKKLFTSPLLIKYLAWKTGIPYRGGNRGGFSPHSISTPDTGWQVGYSIFNIKGSPDGNVEIKIHWALFGLLRVYLLYRLTIKVEEVSAHVLPKLLFWIAIFLGVADIIISFGIHFS